MRVSLVRAVLLPTVLLILGVGGAPIKAMAEPSQTGVSAVATAVAEEPHQLPAKPLGDGLLQPAAATIGAAEKPATASPLSAGSAAPVAGAAGEMPVAAPLPPPAPTLLVGIDLGSQRMTVSERGKVKYTWPVSSGRDGYRTPAGTFRPSWMAKMWYSKQYDDAPMPHAVFFNGGIAVHATQATGMLGRPASHGCIRLAPPNAATFYKLVSSHGKAMTRIKVHGTVRETPVAARSKQPSDQYGRGRAVRELPPYHASGRYSGRQRYSYSGYGNGSYGNGYGGPAPRYVYPGDTPPYGYRPQRPAQRGYYD